MGASLVYLNQPNKEIEHEVGKNDYLSYAAANMQGWRLNMVSKVHIRMLIQALYTSIITSFFFNLHLCLQIMILINNHFLIFIGRRACNQCKVLR